LAAKKNVAADAAAVPSVSILPVADYAKVFHEYEQRTSLYSHTDTARTLWCQMNLACAASLMKHSLIMAFDSQRARMQDARERCFLSTSSSDHAEIESNSLSCIAEALMHGLLFASSRIKRVTVSLFGQALSRSRAPCETQLTTLPPYTMQHSPHSVQLAEIPNSALACSGVPGLPQPHELLHWSCGQDLVVHAQLSAAPWGCCLVGSDMTCSNLHEPNHSDAGPAPMALWSRAREAALRELSRSDDELQAARGHCATLTMPGSDACAMGVVTLHGDGCSPITLYDVVLAQHAVDFAAPLLSASASSITSDLFALSLSLCSGSLLQHVINATSIHQALLAIRDSVKRIFRDDFVAANYFSDDDSSIMHCCNRASPVGLTADSTGLLCFALESQQPLLVVDPLLDPRYNYAIDLPEESLPVPCSGSSCSLLIFPCVALRHPNAPATSVIGFIQIARVHLSSVKPSCFSSVELRLMTKVASSIACAMKLIPQTINYNSIGLRHSSSVDAGACVALAGSRRSQQPASTSSKSLLSRTDEVGGQAPLSSSLLHILSDRRDLALELFRSVSAPQFDPRLRRIASLALAHSDSARAVSVHSITCVSSCFLLRNAFICTFVSC
jgi:hypothetical protein